MADILSEGQDSVIFANSSPENIAYAKKFWKALYDRPSITSTLHVSGISHRLPTAPRAQRNDVSQQEEHPGLINNSNEAERRLKIQEDEYANRVLQQKKKQQDLLRKRKEERLQKEAVRETTIMDEIYTYEDDKGESEDEAIQAMNDIDDFERMVKLAKEQRKERQDFHP